MLKIIAKPPYADHSRMKHLSIKEGFIYNNVKSGQVNIIYVPTTDNLADFLTKAYVVVLLVGGWVGGSTNKEFAGGGSVRLCYLQQGNHKLNATVSCHHTLFHMEISLLKKAPTSGGDLMLEA